MTLNIPQPEPKVVWPRRLAEAVAVGATGSLLGWITTVGFGIGIVGAVVGGINGALSGWRWTYHWRSNGIVAFVLDSTWGIFGTALGTVLNLVNMALGERAGYRFDITYRQNHHVYAAGFTLKKNYAWTLGNVISGAAGSVNLDDSEGSENRRRFIDEHEALHVWQNRWFGPFYQLIYVGWLILGGLVGLVVGIVKRTNIAKAIETVAYFDNPFEYWAYRNNNYWPPRDADQTLVWRKKSPPNDVV